MLSSRVLQLFLLLLVEEIFASVQQECGRQLYDDDNKILGNVTYIEEFPWMALLKYKLTDIARRGKTSEVYLCGGTLLNKRFVLTAAHCVTRSDIGNPYQITIGEYYIDQETDCTRPFSSIEKEERICAPPAQFIPVDTVIVHPDYIIGDKRRQHDIAIIKLAHDAELHDFVMPICLPTARIQENLTKIKNTMYVAGWGATKNLVASNVKKKALLPIVNRDECSKLTTYPLSERQICAGGQKGDSCSGDSGGPLMSRNVRDPQDDRWYIAGIISFGSKNCGTPGVPAVYTNIIYYTDWIQSIIN